ncbi:MAG: hypothetical protein JWO06_2560, partial [Bacteroidota bacterium]|nr:hypothetical protein [Bacteroidota bacterium]
QEEQIKIIMPIRIKQAKNKGPFPGSSLKCNLPIGCGEATISIFAPCVPSGI